MAEQYAWDLAWPLLVEVSGQWTSPNKHADPRQEAADYFFIRSSRRALALATLFREGLYPEAHGVVRLAFEDWVTYSHVLATWDAGSWDEFMDGMNETDARVYEGFRDLWGQEAADEHFPDMPAAVVRWLGVKQSRVDLASRARAVGLEPVYRVAYPYLSAHSHPTSRPYTNLFDKSSGDVVARIPQRDDAAEAAIAMWAIWFELRILTLANRAYGNDVEWQSDSLLRLLDEGASFISAVLVRESVPPA